MLGGFGPSGQSERQLFVPLQQKHRARSILGSLTSHARLSERPIGPARPRSRSRSDRKKKKKKVLLFTLQNSDRRELAYLVEADQVQLAAYIDPLGTNAKDADALQAPLRVHDACRHGRR